VLQYSYIIGIRSASVGAHTQTKCGRSGFLNVGRVNFNWNCKCGEIKNFLWKTKWKNMGKKRIWI